MPYKYPVIDLFCGIGGLSHGFIKEKFKVIAGFDIDNSCKYPFEENNNAPFFADDLSVVSSDKINSLYPKNTTKILVGCAPCQAFSTYSQKNKSNDKWKMLYTFSRIINDIKPQIVSMENVPNLRNYKKGKVLKDFTETLSSNGYHFNWYIIDCSDYGVPQKRNRLILLASKLGAINIVNPTSKIKKVTVGDAIRHLPVIEDGEKNITDPMHKSRKLSSINKLRIKSTPQGGSWKDWSKELVLECHKKESGKSFGSVYGRMSWDDIAPTMTTQCTGYGNGRFGHPEQNRAISLREAAIFQSFPDNYKFYKNNENFKPTRIEKQIGNAVPVKIGQIIAKSIKKHLKEYATK